MSNGNEPEFAGPAEWHPLHGMQIGSSAGLTKRELFAAMAMQGYSANPACIDWRNAEVAAQARDQADHLLAALATPPEERKP